MKAFGILLTLLSLAALAVTPGQLTVTWVAPTQNVDGSAIVGPITYSVYQQSGTTWTKVATGIAGLSWTATGLTGGTKQTYYVVSVAEGSQSGPSNYAGAVVPSATPKPPTAVAVAP